MPGAHAPAASYTKKTRTSSHRRFAETFRHSPRDGFTVSFVLSQETGLCCLLHLRESSSRKLDISVGMPGPHDFAVRVDALRLSRANASIAFHANVS
jgi:hypothetical protein